MNTSIPQYAAIITRHEEYSAISYRLTRNGTPVSYWQAIHGWQDDPEFYTFFTSLLAECPFSAFRWETPACSQTLKDCPFEFVVVDTPYFATRRPDKRAYREYFTQDDSNHGVVVFPNLTGDAELIVPSPRTDDSAYGHLAAFIRQAPTEQVQSLWKTIGLRVREKLGERPIWLSTAGGGVAWLHVRIDRSPKYYAYAPYRASARQSYHEAPLT